MNSQARRFAVVVPMFNEELGAQHCIDQITRVLLETSPSARLIVVNDGSDDRTGEILRDAAATNDLLTVVTHDQNLGYGQASQTGGRMGGELGCDFVVFMDSDLTNDPRFIGTFLTKMDEGFDLVKASRYIPGGGTKGVPAWRFWISRIGNAVSRWLYGLPIHDCTNGFRAVRTDLLRKMTLSERGFPAIMEELYWAKTLQARVGEVPYVLTSRINTLRPSSFQYRPRVFYRYLKYPVLAFFNIRPPDMTEE